MKNKVSKKLEENPRYQAMEVLTRVAKQQAYSNLLVNDVLQAKVIQPVDEALFTELVYGTLGRKLTLQYYLQAFVKKGRVLDSWVEQLLLLSLYQMIYLDRVPAHAILNDAVEIAKQFGNSGIGKFVNGVLRTVQRQGIPTLDTIRNESERVSVETSFPLWLTQKYQAEIGLTETKKMAFSLLEPARVCARVNTTRLSVLAAIEHLASEGIEVETSQVSPVGLIGKRGHLASSSLFKQGLLTIQDESSMLVAPSLQIEKHHQVLDACGAPGGKTTHLASYLDAKAGGRVISLDIHAHKIKLIEENSQRLGVSDRVEAQVLDARKVAEVFPDDYFDRILADVPCSGLGLMRRKPDIKYSKQPTDLTNLPMIQLQILESVAPKLKLWGIMAYSTCTMSISENQEVIARFLAKHPNFEIIPIVGSETVATSLTNQMMTLYPHQYGTDGFFICCLRRIQ